MRRIYIYIRVLKYTDIYIPRNFRNRVLCTGPRHAQLRERRVERDLLLLTEKPQQPRSNNRTHKTSGVI